VLGAGLASIWDGSFAVVAALSAAAKLAWELLSLTFDQQDIGRTRRLLLGPLRWWHVARFVAGLCGAAVMLRDTWMGFALLLMGELLERTLFFRAAAAWRMPRNA
jgi:hypothetical protein